MTPTIIIQGAQYYMPVTLNYNSTTPVTNTNCDDVKIRLNNTTFKASAGEVAYDSYTLDGQTLYGWLVPLTQETTLAMQSGSVPLQAQVKKDDAILPTPVEWITVDTSIIQEVW